MAKLLDPEERIARQRKAFDLLEVDTEDVVADTLMLLGGSEELVRVEWLCVRYISRDAAQKVLEALGGL